MPIALLFGLGMFAVVVFAVRHALRQTRERRQLQVQHPGEPWMWRHDWADRAVRDEETLSPAFLWVFGFLWLLMSVPTIYALRATRDYDRVMLIFFAIFPIVGVCIWIAAAYRSLRRRKYGVSLCRLDRVPVALGSTFHGEVQARVHTLPEHGFQARLTCVRREVRGSGKNRSTHETVLWQDEQTVGTGAAMPHPEGTRIPVQFALPADGEPTDDSNARDSILWRLEVGADVPGIDYIARFTLPVYRVAGAPEADYFPAHNVPAWTPPPYVAFAETRGGGERVTVKPAATFLDWFGYLFFIVLWYAALAFMTRMGVPVWIAVVFGLFGAVVLLAALDLLVGRSVITADRETLAARRGWFGLGRTRKFSAADVEEIVARIGTTTGDRARYNIQARFRSGKARNIAKYLMNRRDAEQVAARVWRALGH